MTIRVKPIPLNDIKQLPYSFQEWVRNVTNLLYSPSGDIPLDSIDVSSIVLSKPEPAAVQQALLLVQQTDTQRILSNRVFSTHIERPVLSGDSQRILETQIFGG